MLDASAPHRDQFTRALEHGWNATFVQNPNQPNRVVVDITRYDADATPAISRHRVAWEKRDTTWRAVEARSSHGPDTTPDDVETLLRARPGAPDIPARAQAVIDTAIAHRWVTNVHRGQDNGGSPYVSIHAGLTSRPNAPEIRLTWHTRDTGTYRLFSAMARGDRGRLHDTTLTKVLATITDLTTGASA